MDIVTYALARIYADGIGERLGADIAALSAIVNEIAASISEEYDPTLTYEAGKLIRHGGKLYRANVAITTPEAWTPEHWTEVDLEDEIAAIKAALADRYTKGETNTLLAGKVSVEQQTLTDPQKAQARANINAAAPDGFYGNSGGVMQYSTNFLGKNAPTAVKDLVFRPTASAMSGTAWSADSIGGDTATIERIKGKTLVWNQLIVNRGTTDRGVTSTFNDGLITLTGTSTNAYFEIMPRRVQLKYNHVYLLRAEIVSNPNNLSISIGCLNWSPGMQIKIASQTGYAYEIRRSNEDGITTIGISGTTAGIDYSGVSCRLFFCDLTQMFGAGNEPDTVEEFRAMFPLDYYDYNEGELISFNGTGLQTTGFNQLDSEGHIHVIGGMTYRIEGAYTSLVDSAGNAVIVTDNEFTPTQDDTYTMVGGSCVHLKWSGVRDGDIEDYWQRTLALPIATYFPDGMKSAGTVYDELMKDKAIQRIGSRDYQEGDEDDTTVVTDGTTTLYALETPVITPISPELNLTYKVDDFGTEKLLPENTSEPVTAPMDADIVYQLDYEAQVRNNDQINISKASMDNFIASFNASGLGTITQTYNPNTKQYEYTVTAPQPTEGGETV